MTIPAISSVTQSTALAAGSASRSDAGTWSSALAQANTVAPADAAVLGISGNEAGSGEPDKGASQAKVPADGVSADQSTIPSAGKKPAKHMALTSTVTSSDAAPAVQTDKKTQSANPLAIMLAGNMPQAERLVPGGGKTQMAADAASGTSATPPDAAAAAIQQGHGAVPDSLAGSGSKVIHVHPGTQEALHGAATRPAADVKANIGASAMSAQSGEVSRTALMQQASVELMQQQPDADGESASRTGNGKAAAPIAVLQTAGTKPTPSTVAGLLARGLVRQAVTMAVPTKATDTPRRIDASSIAVVAQGNVAAPGNPIATVISGTISALPVALGSTSIAASSSSALAATVSAMHQAGQSGTVLHIDPPGLGNLSVHVGLGQQGQVNVLFVPDSAAGAQALQSGLSGLSQAMAQSGLTLGQAQIGGQFGQNAGQGGQSGQGWRGDGTSTPQRNVTETLRRDNGGVSAYA